MKQRLFTILIALDVFVFALLTLGGSKRNETISACAWDMDVADKWQGKFFRPIIDFLLRPLGANHCLRAWEVEQ